MDADDEPVMAYFLPDGIADDSPPKQSRSFGLIGGRSPAHSSVQSTAGPPVNASVAIMSPGPSSSRTRDVDLSGLHARSHPTLEVACFDGPASSSRPSNYLLSDLGGRIHTPRVSRGLGHSVKSMQSHSTPLGSFGFEVHDAPASERAGAIRSPSSIFARNRAAGSNQRRELSHLYRGESMSTYFASVESKSSLKSTSMQSWPSFDASQPRRILQHPPGLAAPPGLSNLNTMEGMHPRESQDTLQQRLSDPQRGLFHRISASLTSDTCTSSSYRTHLPDTDEIALSRRSQMPVSMDAISASSERDRLNGRNICNPTLAELNTRSVQVGMYARKPSDAASTTKNSQTTTTSSKVDVKPPLRMQRSLAKTREDILAIEGRSDLRAKAVAFTMEVTKTLPPKVLVGARQSTSLTKHDSSSGYEGKFYDTEQARGKWQNESASSSTSLHAGSHGRRGLFDHNENPRSMVTAPPGFNSRARLGKIAGDAYETANYRNDFKPLSRSTSKGNAARGNEKTISRRQMYREKQAKDTANEQLLSRGATCAASRRSASSSSQRRQASSDSQMSGVLRQKRHDSVSKNAKSSISLSQPIKNVSARSELETEDAVTAGHVHIKDLIAADDMVATNQSQDAASFASREDRESSLDCSLDPLARTEHEFVSSSDVPACKQSAVKETNMRHRETKGDSTVSSGVVAHSDLSDAERAGVASDHERASPRQKSTKVATESSLSDATIGADASDLDQLSQVGIVEKKQVAKEHRKEKHKKDKADKKKSSRGKKDKRGLVGVMKLCDIANDTATQAPENLHVPLTLIIGQALLTGGSVVATAGLVALRGLCRGSGTGGRLSLSGLFTAMLSSMGSMLVAGYQKALVFLLHVVLWFIQVHRIAFRAIVTHRPIGCCFLFLYGFPFLFQYLRSWVPPWAPVCLWYAFLVQLFCTNGSTAMVTTFRVILPLVFLAEGISHHSFLLDLNGAELLLTSFIISALKINNLCSPIFFLSLATQCLLAVFFESELLVQWLQLALALNSLHAMAATEDEWFGMGVEENELSCHPMSLHHSIADYNRHQVPTSAIPVQKTKRLDRRALAYIRGRKFR